MLVAIATGQDIVPVIAQVIIGAKRISVIERTSKLLPSPCFQGPGKDCEKGASTRHESNGPVTVGAECVYGNGSNGKLYEDCYVEAPVKPVGMWFASSIALHLYGDCSVFRS